MMYTIQLRQDAWFETGEDSVYESKQGLKEALENIGKQDSLEGLAERLSEIPEVGYDFKRTPYLDGKHIYIEIHGLSGMCYLGSVVD